MNNRGPKHNDSASVGLDALRRAAAALPGVTVDFAAEADKAETLRADIYALRESGLSCATIAKRYCMKAEEVEAIVIAEAESVAATARSNPIAAIGLSISRTTTLLTSLWANATGGDVYALDRALRLMERLDKLQGIEDPSKHEVGSADNLKGMTDADLREYRRLQALVAAPKR